MTNTTDMMLDDNITKILNDPDEVTKIIQSGIHDALLRHKQTGNQVCEWRDNKVVWIPADKIVINNMSPTSKLIIKFP